MQAVILAAGMGKRLGDLTKDNTKCMVSVNGVTLIERLLCQLDALSLTKIVLVVGYKANNLREFVSTLNISTPIVYVENDVYDRTNNIYSLYLAKDYLLNEDTLLFESDLIVEDKIITTLVDNPYPDLALVARFESWMDGTVVTIDDENNILRFISPSGFRFEDIPSYYKTVNIYKFSREFSSSLYVPFLEAYCSALGHNEYYEQVLKVITILDRPQIKALPLEEGHWYEIDDVQDLDIASSIFAESAESLNKVIARYGGYWRYPQMVDYCYLVNPYFPNERLMAELRANFDRLVREYPSGQGVNSLLAAKDFHIEQKQVVVGNGAAELIKSLLGRLEGVFGVIRPTFEEYPNRLDGARIVEYYAEKESFRYNEDDIIRFFSENRVDNIVLINPDNPSGNYIPRAGVEKLLKWAEKEGVRIVLDESFVDFSVDGDDATFLDAEYLKEHTSLVVVKSISKSYGVPGLRLGVVASGDENLISEMKKDVAIWNINSFAEFYLQIYGKYENDYRAACETFREERERFMSLLSKIEGVRVLPSEANYFMCELIGETTSAELTEKLLSEYNILIKDCSSKANGRNFIRLAVRDENDNNRLVAAINEITIK